MKRIILGSDHKGIYLKQRIKQHLESQVISVADFGVFSSERSDYPLVAQDVSLEVSTSGDRGILICASGVGMAIAANKINGIRAAVCNDIYTAKFSRLHNDTNILALGAQIVGDGLAIEIVDVWLSTMYEGGRHETRLDIIRNIERSTSNRLEDNVRRK